LEVDGKKRWGKPKIANKRRGDRRSKRKTLQKKADAAGVRSNFPPQTHSKNGIHADWKGKREERLLWLSQRRKVHNRRG